MAALNLFIPCNFLQTVLFFLPLGSGEEGSYEGVLSL